MAPPGSSAKTVASAAPAGSLPSALPPSITMSLGARPLGFADAEHHQARGLEPRRNAQFQRRAAFAAEALGPGGARDMVDGGGDRFRRRRPEFEVVAAKHDQDALGRGGEGAKTEF